ncbi:MAG: ADP-ribosylation factor-like protein [Promethearchaeota archaeon]
MSDYDYNVKVILIGDDAAGKEYLTNRFSKSYFQHNYKYTIGIDFRLKILRVQGRAIKMQLWELVSGDRFKSLAKMYYRGASAAIIIFDILNPAFQYNLEESIQMIRDRSGDIPIALLIFKAQSQEFQVISGVETMLTADNYDESLLTESSFRLNKNPEVIFTKLAEHIIKRFLISPPPRPLKRPSDIRNEFIINKYLKLKLEYDNTNIYVGGRLFRQCKYLLLDITVNGERDYGEIESIDEAAEKLDSSMERGRLRKYYISPDIEFWGHCSNLQVWYEHEYDTRILHRNLAFPLLKALVEVGDPVAEKVFKEEIALRLVSGYPSVVYYLINQGYLKYFNKDEIDSLLNDRDFLKNLPNWFNDFEDIPKFISKMIKEKLFKLTCPRCKAKVSSASVKKFLAGTSLRCERCKGNILDDYIEM